MLRQCVIKRNFKSEKQTKPHLDGKKPINENRIFRMTTNIRLLSLIASGKKNDVSKPSDYLHFMRKHNWSIVK